MPLGNKLLIVSTRSFFFILSMLMEIPLMRNHRKEKRLDRQNDYNHTFSSGPASRKGGFFARFRRNKNAHVDESERLPAHPSPDNRHSYATETTTMNNDGRGPSADYQKQELGYGYQTGITAAAPRPAHPGWHTAPRANARPADHHYGDGIYERA